MGRSAAIARRPQGSSLGMYPAGGTKHHQQKEAADLREADQRPRTYVRLCTAVSGSLRASVPNTFRSFRAPDHDLARRPSGIGPGQSKRNGWQEAPELWHVMHIGPGCPGHAWHLDLEFVFTDNRGARWRRNGEQEPVRLLSSDDVIEDWKQRQQGIEDERLVANERLAADWDATDPEVR